MSYETRQVGRVHTERSIHRSPGKKHTERFHIPRNTSTVFVYMAGKHPDLFHMARDTSVFFVYMAGKPPDLFHMTRNTSAFFVYLAGKHSDRFHMARNTSAFFVYLAGKHPDRFHMTGKLLHSLFIWQENTQIGSIWQGILLYSLFIWQGNTQIGYIWQGILLYSLFIWQENTQIGSIWQENFCILCLSGRKTLRSVPYGRKTSAFFVYLAGKHSDRFHMAGKLLHSLFIWQENTQICSIWPGIPLSILSLPGILSLSRCPMKISGGICETVNLMIIGSHM